MAENNDFESTVDSLFKGINTVFTSKTVVGEAIHVGDTTILPLVDVSFGGAAGSTAGSGKDKMNASGGIGGKMTPNAVLVISGGTTKVVNVKNADSLTKLIDLVPDLVNKFTSSRDNKKEE
ncbi:MAG: GerW family sporulation protein [Lachnospiraceae bacterium]|nr:GerW family sporulation protein [Lachnospiraceae bacterium]